MKSYVQSHKNNEVREQRCITIGGKPGQLYTIHGSTAQGSNTKKTEKNHTLIRGRPEKRKGESPK